MCQVFGGVSLTELIFKIIQTPMQGLTDNWAGAIIIVLLMSLLFWCGLHGPNIVSGIIYPVLTANSLVNQNLMDQGIKPRRPTAATIWCRSSSTASASSAASA